MSGKAAKAVRKELAMYRFPELQQKGVEADHNRRIKGLARAERITIAEAVKRYVKRVGMVSKPKLAN